MVHQPGVGPRAEALGGQWGQPIQRHGWAAGPGPERRDPSLVHARARRWCSEWWGSAHRASDDGRRTIISLGGSGLHSGRPPAIARSLESFGAPVVSLVRARRSLRSMTGPEPGGAGEKEGVLRGRRIIVGGVGGTAPVGVAGAEAVPGGGGTGMGGVASGGGGTDAEAVPGGGGTGTGGMASGGGGTGAGAGEDDSAVVGVSSAVAPSSAAVGVSSVVDPFSMEAGESLSPVFPPLAAAGSSSMAADTSPVPIELSSAMSASLSTASAPVSG